MSKISNTKQKSLLSLMAMKKEGRKISSITCYDAAFARLIGQADIDMVLVGDSLGNVMMGLDDTVGVTMDQMIHHTQCVRRQLAGPVLCADMPFLSYQNTVEDAVRNAGRFFKEAGVQAVKVEGGEEIVPQIGAIVKAGMPVVAHLGFTPQSVHALGGYKVQGRSDEQRKKMLKDALLVQEAGASALVMEMVPAALAQEVTASLEIPTIGIGAGVDCDGQILVLQDMLGFDAEFSPKFLKRFANLGKEIVEALNQYDREVKEKSFPEEQHSFS